MPACKAFVRDRTDMDYWDWSSGLLIDIKFLYEWGISCKFWLLSWRISSSDCCDNKILKNKNLGDVWIMEFHEFFVVGLFKADIKEFLKEVGYENWQKTLIKRWLKLLYFLLLLLIPAKGDHSICGRITCLLHLIWLFNDIRFFLCITTGQERNAVEITIQRLLLIGWFLCYRSLLLYDHICTVYWTCWWKVWSFHQDYLSFRAFWRWTRSYWPWMRDIVSPFIFFAPRLEITEATPKRLQ